MVPLLGPNGFRIPMQGLQAHTAVLSFCMGVRDLNSGPSAFIASALTHRTTSSVSPTLKVFFFFFYCGLVIHKSNFALKWKPLVALTENLPRICSGSHIAPSPSHQQHRVLTAMRPVPPGFCSSRWYVLCPPHPPHTRQPSSYTRISVFCIREKKWVFKIQSKCFLILRQSESSGPSACGTLWFENPWA